MTGESQQNLMLKVGLLFDQTEAFKQIDSQLKMLENSLNKADLDRRLGMKEPSAGMNEFGKNTKKATGLLDELGTKARAQLKNFAVFSFISGSVLFLTTQIRNAIEVTKELDKAYTNFAIVTGATTDEIARMDEQASNLTNTLGRLKVEIIDSITEFSRAGYDLADSITLAEQAIIGANVGFTDLDDVTGYLIAGLKSFNLEAQDAARVIDVLFQVSNKTAIDFAGVGEAFLRSANTLEVAGASLEETTALISAANETILDPTKVGTALKTIAARLRGVGDEGEVIPTLARDFRAIGIDIQNADGSFRNIYDVFKDFAAVYKDLDDLTQQSLIEKIAGKRQANIFVGLIENFDIAEMALTEGLDAIGSSAEANEKFLESMEGRVNTLKNAVNEFYTSLTDSNFLKLTLEGFTALIKIVTALTSGFPGLITGIAGVAAAFIYLSTTMAFATGGLSLIIPLAGGLLSTFLAFGGAKDVYVDAMKFNKEATDELTASQKELREEIERSPLSTKKATAQELSGIVDQIDKLKELQSEQKKSYGNRKELAKASMQSREYAKDIEELEGKLREYGFTQDEAREFINDTTKATEELKTEQFKLADALGFVDSLLIDSSDNHQLLADAVFEMTTQGYLSDEALQKLIETYPEFVAQTGLAKDAVIEFANKAMESNKVAIDNELKTLQNLAKIAQGKLLIYQKEIEGLQNLSEARRILMGADRFEQVIGGNTDEQNKNLADIQVRLAKLGNELLQLDSIEEDNIQRIKDFNDKTKKTVDLLTKEEKAVRDLTQAIAIKEKELNRAESDEQRAKITEDLIGLNKELKSALIAQKDALIKASASLRDGTPEYDKYIDNLYKISLQIEEVTNQTIDYTREQKRLNAEITKSRLKKLLETQLALGEQSINQSLESARNEKKRLEEEYDLEKQKLDLKKEEYEFNKKLSELNESISEAELERQMLLMDNSLESQRRRAELGEQITELQKSKEEAIREEAFRQEEFALDKKYDKLIKDQDNLIDRLEDDLKRLQDATAQTLDNIEEIAETQSDAIGKILVALISGMGKEVGSLGGAWDVTSSKLQNYLNLLSKADNAAAGLPTSTAGATPLTVTPGKTPTRLELLQNLVATGNELQKSWALDRIRAGQYDNGGKLGMGEIAYNKEQSNEWVLTDKNLMTIFERGMSAMGTPNLDLNGSNGGGIDTLINIENMNNTLTDNVDVMNMGKNLAKGASNTLVSRGITI